MVHIEMLAWVDVDTSPATQQRLSSIGPTLNIFSDLNAFIDDITRNIAEADSVMLITSASLGQTLIPMIDIFPQLRTIYIYSADAMKHIHWAQKCNKIGINRVFSEENDLVVQLTADLKKSTVLHKPESEHALGRIFPSTQQETPTINMFAGINCDKSIRDLTEEKVTFLWLQLLNDILINMPKLPTACDEMLDACRSARVNDLVQLRMIDEFQRTYKPEDAINWYTRETFLYQLLNQALRTENVDTIFQFRMIIIDLNQQLTQLFQSSIYTTPKLTVYRGQRMSRSEIEKLRSNTSGLISMNSFVSTTLDEAKAYAFSQNRKSEKHEETVPVVFKLILDVEVARTTNKPFADISRQSRYAGEAEVLLSIGTGFRLEKVEQSSFGTWNVMATMCTVLDDPQVKMLYDYSKNEICSHDRMTYSTYGKFLALMSNFDSAINYLTKLLSYQSIGLQFSDIELATIHNDLAYAYRESSQPSKALEHYEIALELKRNRIPLDEIDLATTYSDMSWLLMWMNMNGLERARDLHEKALTIRRRDYANNRLDVAMSLNCLGLVYVYLSKSDLAKKYLEEALDIRRSFLLTAHPYIAMSYSSLGTYFQEMGDNAEALQMCEQALSIYKQKWQQAIEHLKAALTGYRNHINDSDRVDLFIELGQAYVGLRNYQEALSSYQEALLIATNVNNNMLISEVMKLIEQIKNNVQ